MTRARWGLVLWLAAAPAAAQDFGSAAPPHAPGVMRLLEDALPGGAGWSVGTAWTSWWGLPELTTRAVAAQAPLGAGRVALGLSQTGEEALGWTTGAIAVGAASAAGGGALRAVLRRDRLLSPAAEGAWGAGRGGEAGAGAWIRAAPGTEVWASAPQLVRRGTAPPLARALACGLRVRGGDAVLWAALGGPARGGEAGSRAIGASLVAGRTELWLEARDGPWRCAGGLAAAAGPMQVRFAVETHPQLDETVRVSLSWSRP